jgi:hypothetical protein
VTDLLRVEPRLGIMRIAVEPIVRALFAHRHRQLRRAFAG